jgi:hypothetical protein
MSVTTTAHGSILDGFDDYLGAAHERMDELRAEYLRDGFIQFPDFGTPELRAAVAAEVNYLLDVAAQRRDVTIAATDHSPRRYEAVGRDPIFDNSVLIPALYRSPRFMRFVAAVTGEDEVITAPHIPEEVLISRMTQAGDSHGWHWDDYPYAVIWIIDAPPHPDDGGYLEYIPNTTWDKANPRVQEHLDTHELKRGDIAEGMLYILKADTALHRVAPLVRDGLRRTVLVYTYATPADLLREVSHESMEEVYPEAYEAD